jgi:hypothetical protein
MDTEGNPFIGGDLVSILLRRVAYLNSYIIIPSRNCYMLRRNEDDPPLVWEPGETIGRTPYRIDKCVVVVKICNNIIICQ